MSAAPQGPLHLGSTPVARPDGHRWRDIRTDDHWIAEIGGPLHCPTCGPLRWVQWPGQTMPTLVRDRPALWEKPGAVVSYRCRHLRAEPVPDISEPIRLDRGAALVATRLPCRNCAEMIRRIYWAGMEAAVFADEIRNWETLPPVVIVHSCRTRRAPDVPQ